MGEWRRTSKSSCLFCRWCNGLDVVRGVCREGDILKVESPALGVCREWASDFSREHLDH